jgi:HlyD family secretion protein
MKMTTPPTNTTIDHWEFMPAAMVSAERPPSPYPRFVLYTLLALFAVMLLWSVVGRLDIVAVAQGKLVPQAYLQVVQPSDAGIIKEILVREGDAVTQGQILMRMDTRLSEADRKALQNELQLKRLQIRRIDAELGGVTMTRKPDDVPALFAQVDAQARARRQAFQDALEAERAMLAKARHDLKGASETEAKLRLTGPMFREQEEAWEKLTKEGFAGRLYLLERQRQRIENEQDLKTQQNTLESLKATIAQSDKRIAQITSNYHQQLQNERVETVGQLAKLDQEWDKHLHRHDLLELRAPQGGTIKDLATHTVGTVVQPATILLTIVPQNEPLLAEVWVSNLDAGFVEPGQPVRLKLTAFPFQKYGMVNGKVKHVSADASERGAREAQTNTPMLPEGADMSALSYRALVALAGVDRSASGAPLRLSPGMQVSAEILLGTRSVFEYLVSPVQKVVHEAGRER